MKVFFRLIRTIFKIDHELESINEKLEFILDHKDPDQGAFPEKWLDGQEVMQKLHISERTLLRLRQQRQLTFTRINRKFYYREGDVTRLLSSGRR